MSRTFSVPGLIVTSFIHQSSALSKAPPSHSSKKLPAEEEFFSSAAKPVVALTVQRKSDSEAKTQKDKSSNSKAGPSSDSYSGALTRVIHPKFRVLVDVLKSKRSEGISFLSFTELGAALLQRDKNVYEKAGAASAKKYATLAHKEGVVVFASDKSGSEAVPKTGEFVGLHPQWEQA